MSWVKLDDHFPENPKIRAVGHAGLALHIEAICYSARNLTDGKIPASSLPYLTALPPRRAKELASRMVTAGLWELVPDGYQVHDYLEYNPSRAEVLAKRSKDSARKTGGFRRESLRPVPDPVPRPDPVDVVEAKRARTIFTLYEEVFGGERLNALEVEELNALEEEHPAECIEHCFKAAATTRPRPTSLGWVKRRLESHRRDGCDGKPNGADRREQATGPDTESVASRVQRMVDEQSRLISGGSRG